MRDVILSDVRLFAKAVELGGLAQAADVLKVPKASASRQLQRLEARLGHLLLYRGAARFALTEEGREFLRPAQDALNTLDQALSNLPVAGNALSGQLRIVVPNYFGRDLLAPHLPDFMAAHPHLEIAVTAGSQEVDLFRDEADVAIRFGRTGCEELVARRLKVEPMMLCAAPAYLERHPEILEIQDLGNHFLLTADNEGESGKKEVTIPGLEQEHRLRVAGVFRASDPEILLKLAGASRGVALVLQALARPEIERGSLVPVLPALQLAPQELNLLYLPARRNSPKIRAFIDHMLGVFSPM